MNAVYGRHKFRKLTRCVGRGLFAKTEEAQTSREGSDTFARQVGGVALDSDVERRGLLKSPASRPFDFGWFSDHGAGDDYREVHVDELEKAVAFDQNARRFDSFQRELYPPFDLIGRDDDPVDVLRAGVPVSTGILIGSIGLLKT